MDNWTVVLLGRTLKGSLEGNVTINGISNKINLRRRLIEEGSIIDNDVARLKNLGTNLSGTATNVKFDDELDLNDEDRDHLDAMEDEGVNSENKKFVRKVEAAKKRSQNNKKGLLVIYPTKLFEKKEDNLIPINETVMLTWGIAMPYLTNDEVNGSKLLISNSTLPGDIWDHYG